MIYKNYIRVLYIRLESKKIRIEERQDLTQYLGGTGVASKLLEENMRPELDPLAPEQPIIFAIGALSAIYPAVTKTVAMFISPLTGELGESHAGGRLAMAMFQAGFDAIVITGRADAPYYLSITGSDVLFRNAEALWKTDNDSTGQIIRYYEHGYEGKRSIVHIGRAGENLVSYACVIVDRYRHFGRLGLGAVFGSKQLKAINIAGDNSIPIENYPGYLRVYNEIFKKVNVPDGPMAKYHDIGTPVNIEPLNAIGGLPALNLKQGSFEGADGLSGEEFAQKHLIRKMACTGCPVGCIHIGQFRRAFAETGYEYESVSVGYDYELIFSLGTFLGVDSSEKILEMINEVEICGLDAMSTGVALGWATEALEKGLVSEKDTIVPLYFGGCDSYVKAIHFIAECKNEFYRHLGKGVRHASEIYGGADFAMHIEGNEMAGYHTGYGSLVGAAVGARHSHLCNAGYSIDQGTHGNFNAEDMARSLFNEEVERCMLNSLVICLFARKVYDRETVIKALAAVGYELTNEDLTAIARRNYSNKLRIKKALGFNWENIILPKRFYETPSANGRLDEATVNEILTAYRRHISELESV